MKRPANEWDFLGMDLAARWAEMSKDPNKQVGAAMCSPDRRRWAFGYNGLPRDFEERLGGVIMDRDQKNRHSLHAEDNAVAQAGCDTTGWTMYVTAAPCLRCAIAAHRAGVARLVCPPVDPESSWAEEQRDGLGFLQTMGVALAHVEAAPVG